MQSLTFSINIAQFLSRKVMTPSLYNIEVTHVAGTVIEVGLSKYKVVTTSTTGFFDCKDIEQAKQKAEDWIAVGNRAGQTQTLISIEFVEKH